MKLWILAAIVALSLSPLLPPAWAQQATQSAQAVQIQPAHPNDGRAPLTTITSSTNMRSLTSADVISLLKHVPNIHVDAITKDDLRALGLSKKQMSYDLKTMKNRAPECNDDHTIYASDWGVTS